MVNTAQCDERVRWRQVERASGSDVMEASLRSSAMPKRELLFRKVDALGDILWSGCRSWPFEYPAIRPTVGEVLGDTLGAAALSSGKTGKRA